MNYHLLLNGSRILIQLFVLTFVDIFSYLFWPLLTYSAICFDLCSHLVSWSLWIQLLKKGTKIMNWNENGVIIVISRNLRSLWIQLLKKGTKIMNWNEKGVIIVLNIKNWNEKGVVQLEKTEPGNENRVI